MKRPFLSIRRPQRWLLLLAGVLLGVTCGGEDGPAPIQPATPNPSAYIAVENGTLPVVISVPHGGTMAVPGVPERTSPGATTVLDTNTFELGREIQTQLLSLTGRKAHLVSALASRKYVDFNRNAAEAYESPAMASIYAFYHSALLEAVNAAKLQSAAGAILVDIHGQGTTPGLIYRGTQNGLTADLQTLYRSAPNGLLSEMLARGLTVSPGTSAVGEHASFTGGYIVVAYGFPGGASNRVNAVQLEFGIDFRSPDSACATTATRLAAAIKAHLLATGALAPSSSRP